MLATIDATARDLESEGPLASAVRTTCSEERCPDFEEPSCVARAPGLRMSITPPLSWDDLQRIGAAVGRGYEPTIIRVEDWSPNGAPDQPTTGADRILLVTTWGGYNRCLRSGKNFSFVVERVGGVWRRVGKGARFVEYMH